MGHNIDMGMASAPEELNIPQIKDFDKAIEILTSISLTNEERDTALKSVRNNNDADFSGNKKSDDTPR